MKKLAIITTHPIQYYAPLFKMMHERKQVEIRVFYTWGENSIRKHDPGFKKHIQWDLPLLEGYPYEWVLNTAADPGSHHFSGIKNPDLINQINYWQADAILVIGWAYHSHLKVMRNFKGKIPVYFRGDSTLLDEKGGLKSILKKWLLKWIYSHADNVFYAGKQNKNYFLEYGVPESGLSFTPNAVDNARFAEDRSAEGQELRRRLGIKGSEILILFAGKLEAKKDPLLLLDAFLGLKNRNAHLLFVGNGPLEYSLKSHVSNFIFPVGNGPVETDLRSHISNPQSNNVHFMEFQNQTRMPIVYQASDLFCLPSKGPGESWGLAINEAMACGKGILASDKVGGAYDLIQHGGNGFLFSAGDFTDLTKKLKHMVSDKSRLKDYGQVSKDIIQSWNLETVAIEIERAITKLSKYENLK